jgi:hypothetical protein
MVSDKLSGIIKELNKIKKNSIPQDYDEMLLNKNK